MNPVSEEPGTVHSLQWYDNLMDAKLKHLEMIQGVINRMGANSFMLKSWAVVRPARGSLARLAWPACQHSS